MRVEIGDTVMRSVNGTLRPWDGATVNIYDRDTQDAVTWYDAETGGSPSSAALTTDEFGRYGADSGGGQVWVEEGSYDRWVNNAYYDSIEAVRGGSIADHLTDTTDVHGIPDTSQLATVADVNVEGAWVNVMNEEFGAVGNGVADDTQAIKDAILAADGGAVVFPKGTYLIDETLDLTATGAMFIGVGQGSQASVIKAKTGSNLAYMVRMGNLQQRIQDLRFDGNNDADVGVLVHNAGRGSLSNVFVTRTDLWGVKFDNSPAGFASGSGNNNSFRLLGVTATSNTGVGIGVGTTGSQTDNNAILALHLTCTLNGSHGVELRLGVNGWNFFGGHMESNGGYGMKLGDAAEGPFVVDCSIWMPWLEANTSGGVLFGKASRCFLWRMQAGQGMDYVNGRAECSEIYVHSSGGRLRVRAGTQGNELAIGAGAINVQSPTQTDLDMTLTPLGAGDVAAAAGHVRVDQVGKGLKVKEGANAKAGVATLVAGTVTVNTTAVTANSRIQLTAQTSGAAPGALRVSARVPGTSFTITSTSGTDTSQVAWMIVEPA